MTKFTFFLLAILLTFSKLFAQNEPIKFGAKLGFSHSNVEMPANVKQFDGFGATNNFHLGLIGEFDLQKSFGLKLEMLYSQKGGQSFFVLDPSNQIVMETDEKLRFNFIAFPVLLTYQFANFQLEGGVETAFRQNTKFIIGGTKLKVNNSENRIDLGLNVGVNYVFNPFFIGVRYNHGLREMPLDFEFTDDNGATFSPQPTFLNRVWQFSIGYRI